MEQRGPVERCVDESDEAGSVGVRVGLARSLCMSPDQLVHARVAGRRYEPDREALDDDWALTVLHEMRRYRMCISVHWRWSLSSEAGIAAGFGPGMGCYHQREVIGAVHVEVRESMKAPADSTELLARALGVLRSRGERVTTARRGVLGVLASTSEHLSAERIYDEVVVDTPDVHRATVYRTLDALVSAGVIAHVHLPHGPAAYHLQDTDARPHIHLVCRQCKTVIDTAPDLLDGAARSVLDAHGFELDPDHVALTGWCSRCRSDGATPHTPRFEPRHP